MLERCIEEDKAVRMGKRKDPFYEKLKILRESQKRWEERTAGGSVVMTIRPKH
jgi:hypothetical protein